MIGGRIPLGVRGGGVAATVCAHLLGTQGHPVDWQRPSARTGGAAVMLGEQALHLLRDLFGRPDLFAEAPAIERRIVLWGGEAEPRILPHPARVVTAADLDAGLTGATLRAEAGTVPGAPFLIDAAPPAEAPRRTFGDRLAIAVAVSLRPEADQAACLIESTRAGWLFLIPQGQASGWLLAVGGSPQAMLGESRLVANAIDGTGAELGSFQTVPRLLEQVVGDDWLACGSQAIAFDPLCGDGTAQAAREAILAAAVALEIGEGRDRAPLLRHYRAMLIAAMRRHLLASLSFYRSGGSGDWWAEQVAATADAHAYCTALLAQEPEPAFVLRGIRLHSRQAAA